MMSARQHFLGRLGIAVLAASVCGVLTPGEVLANHLNCGDTISASTTFDSNLDCSGDALTIDASGVILDLNGFLLSQSAGGPPGTGVIIEFGTNSVVIRDGEIAGFLTGVLVEGSSATVEQLDINMTTEGIVIEGRNNIVQHNTLNDIGGNSITIQDGLVSSNNNRIFNNIINVCGDTGVKITPGSTAVPGTDTIDNVIRANTIFGCSGVGIALDQYSSAGGLQNTIIRGNDLNLNGFGMLIQTEGNIIRSNDVTSSIGVGVWVTQATNILRGNDIIANGTDGVRLTDSANDTTVGINTIEANGNFQITSGDGVVIETSLNTLRRNSVDGNAGNGVTLGHPDRSQISDNVLQNNTSNQNGVDGIRVNFGAFPTRLDSNTTRKNAGSGVFIDSGAPTTILSNAASQNDVSGIVVVGTAQLDSNRVIGNTVFGYDTADNITDLGSNRGNNNGTDCRTPSDFPNSPQAC